jgi:hypothetical protein
MPNYPPDVELSTGQSVIFTEKDRLSENLNYLSKYLTFFL